MSKYSHELARRQTHNGRVSEMGRSRMLIVCPFCNTEVWGYLWSLSGGGKKCPDCGAIHTYGVTFPLKKCGAATKWCKGRDLKLVQERSQTAGAHGTNEFKGDILYMCSECRKAHNGGFKIIKPGAPSNDRT